MPTASRPKDTQTRNGLPPAGNAPTSAQGAVPAQRTGAPIDPQAVHALLDATRQRLQQLHLEAAIAALKGLQEQAAQPPTTAPAARLRRTQHRRRALFHRSPADRHPPEAAARREDRRARTVAVSPRQTQSRDSISALFTLSAPMVAAAPDNRYRLT